MKTGYRTFAVYATALILVCFLSLDKIIANNEESLKTRDGNLFPVLAHIIDFGNYLGVYQTLHALEGLISPALDKTYKNIDSVPLFVAREGQPVQDTSDGKGEPISLPEPLPAPEQDVPKAERLQAKEHKPVTLSEDTNTGLIPEPDSRAHLEAPVIVGSLGVSGWDSSWSGLNVSSVYDENAGIITISGYNPANRQIEAYARITSTSASAVSSPDSTLPENTSYRTLKSGYADESTNSAVDPGEAFPDADNRLLVIGDSIAQGLAVSLERRLLKFEGIKFFQKGKVSSGILNKSYFDWENTAKNLIAELKPRHVVVMMGANDARYFALKKKNDVVEPCFGKETYRSRLTSFISALTGTGVNVHWIGLPIMGDPDYCRQVRCTNEIASQVCGQYDNCRFIDTWSVLADEKSEYAKFMRKENGSLVKLRENDNIHLTPAGNDILAQFFINYLSNYVKLHPKQEHRVVGMNAR